MKRVLLTGAHGLLGQKIAEIFQRESETELLLTARQQETFYSPLEYDYVPLDITQRNAVRDLVESFRPDVIINSAAFTDVDRCEREREQAWNVNVHGVQNLTASALRIGCAIVHISTDYIFDGKNGPYDERARPNPINYYGKSKLAGENVLRGSGVPFAIVRTMSLYGTGNNIRPNFVLRILMNLRDGKSAYAPIDQWTNPTLANEVAYAILKIVEREKFDIYHVSGSERLTRYQFAVKIAEVFHFDPSLIQPKSSDELRNDAQRPKCSGFITLKAETELGIRFSNVAQGLNVVKRELSNIHKIRGLSHA
ncbi:MAG: dTDP-4-dehydrorhamnose reductase [Bacteroidota bacterium]